MYGRGHRQRGGLISKGVRAAATGIGLASESIKAHKESKAAAKAQAKAEESSSRGEPEVGMDKLEISSSGNQSQIANQSRPLDEAPPSYTEVAESSSASLPAQSHPRGSEQYPDEKKRSSEPQSPDEENNVDNVELEDNLEEEWSLDDAQDEFISEPSGDKPLAEQRDLEDAFIAEHPPPEYTEGLPYKIPLPVVIPQRRPKNRARGFVRAYAPVLENCGIDQATWLTFLDKFQKSSAADPWIQAVNLASIPIGLFVPMGVGIAIQIAIQRATDVTMEMQTRYRTNTFLQKINENFFCPRGLFCLVMTWNPESNYRVQEINLTETIASRSGPSSGVTGVTNKFSSSSGKTYGEATFPEVAPLVFPALDDHASQNNGEGAKKKKSKMAERRNFVSEYYDKRATAAYASANPNSALASVPTPEFKSRYADPNNPASSGSLIAFVSGGKLVPEPNAHGLIGGIASVVGQKVRGEKQGAAWERYRASGGSGGGYYSRDYRGGRIPIGPIGLVKKVLKKNVLYLMVVNMPSEEEMAAAMAKAPRK